MSRPKASRWDRFLLSVAPGYGMRRLQAKAVARSYDAAGTGRRTSGWHKSGADANAANGPSLAALRNISRDLYRNNGWARRGIKVIRHDTVGYGITAKASGSPQASKRAMDLWKAWANSTACDFDGRLNFAGLQGLAMQTIIQSGEVLILKRTPEATQLNQPAIPLQLRVIEPDHLDSSKDGLSMASDGGYILQGIEFDARGRRIAYWLFPAHPGGQVTMRQSLQSQRIPAADVLHVYMPERPGQMRGVPWLCAAIAKVHDFHDYDDAKLMQAKIASCFGAFVTDLDGAGGGALGEQDADDEHLESLEPGHIEYLPPGKQISFAQPTSTSDHAAFSATSLRHIAAALGGVTYEELSLDYSQVNYSSARMARMAKYGYIEDARWNMLIPQMCDGVWRWAMGLAVDVGLLRVAPAVEWTPPPMLMLDPDKEGLAYTRLIRSGAKTLNQVIRELGEDPDVMLQEIADTNKKLDELGIVLDSDPRKTTNNGQSQQAADEESAKSKGGTDAET